MFNTPQYCFENFLSILRLINYSKSIMSNIFQLKIGTGILLVLTFWDMIVLVYVCRQGMRKRLFRWLVYFTRAGWSTIEIGKLTSTIRSRSEFINLFFSTELLWYGVFERSNVFNGVSDLDPTVDLTGVNGAANSLEILGDMSTSNSGLTIFWPRTLFVSWWSVLANTGHLTKWLTFPVEFLLSDNILWQNLINFYIEFYFSYQFYLFYFWFLTYAHCIVNLFRAASYRWFIKCFEAFVGETILILFYLFS